MLHPPGFLFFLCGAGGWWPWWPEVEKRLLPSLSVAGEGLSAVHSDALFTVKRWVLTCSCISNSL